MSSYEYYYSAPRRSTTARALCGVFGVLTGAVLGVVTLLTAGEGAAIALGLVILTIAFYGALGASRGVSALIAFGLIAGFAWGSFYLGNTALTIYRAINGTAGPVDPADPVLFAGATSKFDEAAGEAGFRIELHETELTSYVQGGLADIENNPVRRISIDIEDGSGEAEGTIALEGEFKSGGVAFDGLLGVRLQSGAVQVEVIKLELGAIELPGIGKNAIEDLLEEIADLNATLDELRADVQSIEIGNDRVLVTGTHPAGNLLTSQALLSGIAAQAASVGTAVVPPPEPLPPGVVNSLASDGATYYVALGDSLAANVGVSEPALGYVSRVHRALQSRDGRGYGLRNFGVSGETSGTLIRSGQLDTAIAFMSDVEVEYLTIDIGANDLLGHLGSDDCAASIDALACEARVSAAFETYTVNMAAILDALRAAEPDATIVFVRAYNPFSLGLGGGVEFERRSDEILDAFNDIAAGLAVERGMRVADAFTPLQGTTAATTHMLDSPPDIHPFGIGYSLIAQAVVEAIE